ncbi:MAG TPA: QacE family quaternary ammonium compound efflux SMR transporter [Candidatus Stackebrandtia faecavium]|nr:QacE family quaternary ammonium compound efflux SMR transporter [Candidatus Stackebrandtia faecavium]
MKAWFSLGGAIAAEIVGTLTLRAAVDNPLWFPLVAGTYLAAFSLLALALRSGMSIGVAYGIWGATGVALVALLATAIFGDALTAPILAGIVLIIAGVTLIETGSRHKTPAAIEEVAS